MSKVSALQELLNASELFDQDGCFVEYDIINRNLNLYYIHRHLSFPEKNQADFPMEVYKVVFHNCSHLFFLDFAADMRVRYDRNREVYDTLFYGDYGMQAVNLKERQVGIEVLIDMQYFDVSVTCKDIEIEIGYLPNYRTEFALINRECFITETELGILQQKLTMYLNYQLLDCRMRYFLDDLEFILKEPDGTIRYVCLGKCQSMRVEQTSVKDLELSLVYTKEVIATNSLYPERFNYESVVRDGPYIQANFNLLDEHYQLLFQLVEIGELPEDVTSFDHDFFYGEELQEKKRGLIIKENLNRSLKDSLQQLLVETNFLNTKSYKLQYNEVKQTVSLYYSHTHREILEKKKLVTQPVFYKLDFFDCHDIEFVGFTEVLHFTDCVDVEVKEIVLDEVPQGVKATIKLIQGQVSFSCADGRITLEHLSENRFVKKGNN